MANLISVQISIDGRFDTDFPRSAPVPTPPAVSDTQRNARRLISHCFSL